MNCLLIKARNLILKGGMGFEFSGEVVRWLYGNVLSWSRYFCWIFNDDRSAVDFFDSFCKRSNKNYRRKKSIWIHATMYEIHVITLYIDSVFSVFLFNKSNVLYIWTIFKRRTQGSLL